LIKSPMSGVRVFVGAFDLFILPIGRVCSASALTLDGTAAHATPAVRAAGGGRQS
jgi:hypothetical protein